MSSYTPAEANLLLRRGTVSQFIRAIAEDLLPSTSVEPLFGVSESQVGLQVYSQWAALYKSEIVSYEDMVSALETNSMRELLRSGINEKTRRFGCAQTSDDSELDAFLDLVVFEAMPVVTRVTD